MDLRIAVYGIVVPHERCIFDTFEVGGEMRVTDVVIRGSRVDHRPAHSFSSSLGTINDSSNIFPKGYPV